MHPFVARRCAEYFYPELGKLAGNRGATTHNVYNVGNTTVDTVIEKNHLDVAFVDSQEPV